MGNVAKPMVAVGVAYKNRMSLANEIAVGSSLQIALFVLPVLVCMSLIMGNPLIIATLVAEDGQGNWLGGAVLITLYLMIARAFFLLH